MSAFTRFQADLEQDFETVRGEIAAARDKLVTEAHEGVVNKTPVDTGFARNSWFVEAGDGTTRESNNGSGGPLPSQVLPTVGAFTPVTIGNGAPYINELEDGRSDQAPNGMVGITLAELETRFRRIE